jgi:hypothetical protein
MNFSRFSHLATIYVAFARLLAVAAFALAQAAGRPTVLHGERLDVLHSRNVRTGMPSPDLRPREPEHRVAGWIRHRCVERSGAALRDRLLRLLHLRDSLGSRQSELQVHRQPRATHGECLQRRHVRAVQRRAAGRLQRVDDEQPDRTRRPICSRPDDPSAGLVQGPGGARANQPQQRAAVHALQRHWRHDPSCHHKLRVERDSPGRPVDLRCAGA